VEIIEFHLSDYFNIVQIQFHMNYYFAKTIERSFDDGVRLVTDGLKAEGFGVISEIRMHEKLKEKLGVEFKKYTILGACNPAYAYKALKLEDKIGAMLPCNVLVIDQGNGKTEIAAINPAVSMISVANPELDEVGKQVSAALKKVVDQI
jgi:uncharacterized protein (DUF302 family)